jgi:hypothetical protein
MEPRQQWRGFSVVASFSGLQVRNQAIKSAALALHLDCGRTYLGQLEANGVIQRRRDGSPLDRSRVA